ncbi:MAG TPA: BadF/BadG/BcrA/BcrD ATPase family protein [Pyrinomonadaceae bacterium]|jgi:N-acetylglucosamine kinase-like BadF-type ATPase
MEIILAIDGGGSRTRCLAIDRSGQILADIVSGPSNHLLIDGEIVKQSLAEAIDQALDRSKATRADVIFLSAGLAGVDFDGTGAPEMETLLRELGYEKVLINGDIVIAHAGALALKPGVIALAGTGSAFFGVGLDGERVKVGGWGPIYGDEGSAYRIGQLALRGAASGYDGRGPETALTVELPRALGLAEFRETVSRIYVGGMESREIAALSRVAYEVAEAGDEVARNLFFHAGEELAEGVEATIRRLKLGEREVPVSYQGSVVDSCRLLRDRFVERLGRTAPNCKVVPPRFEPVIGAYLLGRKALGLEMDNGVFAALRRNERR